MINVVCLCHIVIFVHHIGYVPNVVYFFFHEWQSMFLDAKMQFLYCFCCHMLAVVNWYMVVAFALFYNHI
jgi:hypothetical protein